MSDDVQKPYEEKGDAEQPNAEQLNAEQVVKELTDATAQEAEQSTSADAAETGQSESTVEQDSDAELSALGGPEISGEQLAKLENELDDTKGQMLRLQAEMQNIQRRAKKDVEKAHKFGVERFVKELLPVLDSLEKAIEACDAGEDSPAQVVSVRDGVEMTLSMMLSAMKKFEVEVIDPMGETFDPQFHEAMSMVPRNDVDHNSVIAVLQKGYKLSGRLVRPAMVMVAKGQ